MPDEESTRERVLETIRRFPGIHLRGLIKELDTSTALARYHIQVLEKEGRVRSSEVGGFVRYFPVEDYKELSRDEREMLNVLRQERPLEIVLTLLEFGPMQHRDLLETMGGSKGTLTYHLDKLVAAGIVRKVSRGPERGFHLVDADRVRALLSRYEPVPALLSHVHDLWDDLFRGHRTNDDKGG
ncbi:MAG: winged helix-turn-helix transcriptional regulator [Euryarchaeota archaeon]|nr:winged helix-turn-helix transcriptional regulator [Euryarchaeota archaeon]